MHSWNQQIQTEVHISNLIDRSHQNPLNLRLLSIKRVLQIVSELHSNGRKSIAYAFTCVTWSESIHWKHTILDISFCFVLIIVLLLKGGNRVLVNYTVKYIDYTVTYSGDYSRLKLLKDKQWTVYLSITRQPTLRNTETCPSLPIHAYTQHWKCHFKSQKKINQSSKALIFWMYSSHRSRIKDRVSPLLPDCCQTSVPNVSSSMSCHKEHSPHSQVFVPPYWVCLASRATLFTSTSNRVD